MALTKTESGWLLLSMTADVDPHEPKYPQWKVYDYGDVAFISAVITGKRFSAWLTSTKGKVRGYGFQIPKFQPRIRSEHYTSRTAMRELYRLPYPFTLYPVEFQNRDNAYRNDSSPLVKDGLPSFINFGTAIYRFLYDLDNRRWSDIPRDYIMVRMSHPEAWIDDVTVEKEAVTVTINGTQVTGARLTVGGSFGVLVNEVLNRAGTNKYEISSQDSDNLWLVLSRGDRWLDSREIYSQRITATWDVTGIQPGNLAAHIQELLLQGEGERLEYKSKVPDAEKKFLKTVAAFANGSGGILLVGVSDDGKVEGIKEDIGKCMDAITNSIRNGLTPQPTIHLERCEVDHRQIIGVFIKQGEEPPYGLNTKPPQVYVRRGGTTFDATQAEIRGLGAKNQPQQQGYYSNSFQ